MQVINGAAAAQTVNMLELAKKVPTRLIRLFLRIANLRQGQYVVYLSVGEDDISWRLGEMGHMEH